MLSFFLTLAVVTWDSSVAKLKDYQQVLGNLGVVVAPNLIRLSDTLHLLAIALERVILWVKRPECVFSFKVSFGARTILQICKC